jgi:hypothetical protein
MWSKTLTPADTRKVFLAGLEELYTPTSLVLIRAEIDVKKELLGRYGDVYTKIQDRIDILGMMVYAIVGSIR